MSSIQKNLRLLRERIARACDRADRDPDEVRLVAVTKSVGMAEIEALYDAGVRDVGENRPQQLWERRAAFEAKHGTPGDRHGVPSSTPRVLQWHLIGHLQTNKLNRTLPQVDLLHALDRSRLIEAIAARESSGATAGAAPVRALLQVNVSAEPQKHGFAPADVAAALAATEQVQTLQIEGLMCMAPFDAAPDASRAIFRRLRELRDDPALSRYLVGRELSMGMSGDFEVAVEEGATLVRIGRALFVGDD